MVYSISGISSRAFSSFCREKLEYHNIITTAAGGSTRPPWSSSRRCFPPWSCSCGRCFPWECSRSRGLSKGSPAEVCPCGHMSVAVEQNVPRGKGRQICNELFTWADVYDTARFASDFRVRSRHGLPKFFRNKKTPHRTKQCGKNENLPGRHSYWLGPAHEATAHWADCLPCQPNGLS